MKAKIFVVVVSILFFGISILVTEAQDSSTDQRLWGVWKAIVDPAYDDYPTFVFFTPNGAYGYQYIEGLTYGSYSASDGVLNINLTLEYAETIHTIETENYEFIGNKLRIYGVPDGYTDFELYHRFTGFGFIPCPATVKSNMFVGAWGHVTYTDGTPSRMRSGPSTSSTVVSQLPEGYMFVVVGEPKCSDGYTWWPINSNAYNPGSGMDNNHTSGWIAEGSDGVAFIEPTGWIDTGIISHDIPVSETQSVENLMQQVASQTGGQYYAPGEYPFAEKLAHAIASGSLSDAFPKTYAIIDSAIVIVLTRELPLPKNGLELVCFTATLNSLGVINDKRFENDTVSLTCVTWDTVSIVGKSGPVAGTLYFLTQNLLNPSWLIDKLTLPFNEWAGTFPLTRFVCWVKPDACPF